MCIASQLSEHFKDCKVLLLFRWRKKNEKEPNHQQCDCVHLNGRGGSTDYLQPGNAEESDGICDLCDCFCYKSFGAGLRHCIYGERINEGSSRMAESI